MESKEYLTRVKREIHGELFSEKDLMSAFDAGLKSALDNADHWMARKEECARENAKLSCLLDDADAALEAIKNAGSKGEARRIAMQALGEELEANRYKDHKSKIYKILETAYQEVDK